MKSRNEMKFVQVVINEQHSLLSEQEQLLNKKYGDTWELFKIPSEGLTKKDMSYGGDVYRLLSNRDVVFCSPIPLLLRNLTVDADGYFNIKVFHNDIREKKELPNGKIIQVVAKEGWELL